MTTPISPLMYNFECDGCQIIIHVYDDVVVFLVPEIALDDNPDPDQFIQDLTNRKGSIELEEIGIIYMN